MSNFRTLSCANLHVFLRRSLRSITYWYVNRACSSVSSTDHSSLNICIGPLALRPYNSSNGENPNDSCGISLTANNNAGRYLSQSFERSAHIVSKTCFNITWNFSIGPLLYGRYGIVINCWSDNNLLTSFMTSIVTLLSCSISISLGIPTLLNIAINASATRSVSMLGYATASGYLVA